MATTAGFIGQIKFRNEENDYTVTSVANQNDREEVITVGNLVYATEGDIIEASSHMVQHSVHGEQLQIESYEIKIPQDKLSMERYPGSDAIKGIGAASAVRIMRHFKAGTFRVMEEEPKHPFEIRGASEKMVMVVAEQVEDRKDMRQAMMLFQDYGTTINLVAKIYQEYGPALYRIIRENFYRLVDDIPGMGLKMIDEIAKRVGIFTDPGYCIKVGILHTPLLAIANGHTYLPQAELFAQVSELLKVGSPVMEKYLMDMQTDRKMVAKPPTQGTLVYPPHCYYLELNVTCMLRDPNVKGDIPQAEIKVNLFKVQQQESTYLDELQEKAVYEAVNSDLLVITGGPGIGKTTATSTTIRYFETEGMEILPAASTGRITKWMTKTTGYEARTIHCTLELVPVGMFGNDTPVIPSAPRSGRGARSMGMHFDKNKENPLDADIIIIDEMSMVDISPMHSPLRAVNVDTRLTPMGDMDQLPSTGPGNVLRGTTESGSFNVVKLVHVLRQAAQSDTVINAHKVSAGKSIDLVKHSQDLLFIRRDNPNAAISVVITLIQKEPPDYVYANASDIQVTTSMRKGALGVECLNQIMQSYLSPPGRTEKEEEAGGTTYRVGDKVMQIRNNYQMEWEVRNKYGISVDKGAGIFNGGVGIIREINESAGLFTVESDEGKMIEYNFKQLEELGLACTITIRKSQGNEYPAIIIPVYNSLRVLMTYNLIYTAMTRAHACVCLTGQPDTFYIMAVNHAEQKRYSGLKSRIGEICTRPDSVG